ncbi:SGNH/GDSL hydrolase family protein [Cryobacterium arcticum]|uniref:SGNH/GDSL hydrolase family protein n=1 Tax=Cryobacterium arcticum TaxID=670052 RepID=A0A317ZS50_9MICO|nr:SGNH/GDSL hydrolase family protein [Cryobacterium arcticum]PXA70024.1 SGNH/GDSL hydrolase family protein [Cryobacterium arcticum]
MSRGKLILLGILAIAVVVLTVMAVQGPRPGAPTAAAGPIPTFGTVTSDPHPVAAFVGDSYTTGTGATVKVKTRWTALVSAEMEWKEVNLGRGGTGYATTSGRSGCGKEYCPSFVEMIPEVLAVDPDVVFISGGRSDIRAWDADPSIVIAAITQTYADMRSAVPDARIIAVGPAVSGTVTQDAIDMDLAVESAATAVGAEFISLLNPSVLDASLLSGDRIHPNNAGHSAIARRIVEGLGTQ